jgi:peptidoglycan/LPS O-acetylase OafA/YrhL
MKLYFPVINLIRGIAALLVAIYHFTNFSFHDAFIFQEYPWLLSAGQIGLQGVYIFFVISGVVIPVSMYSGGFRAGAFHRFIARRWLRIEIPYFATIGLVLLIAAFFAWKNQEVFVFEPVRLLHHLSYTVPFTDYEWYNVIFWTLAIEFQYYLIIGLLYPLITSRTKWVMLKALLLFGFSVLLLPNDRFVFFFAPIFALGILVFLRRSERISAFEQWGFSLLMIPLILYYHGLTVTVFATLTALAITFVTVKKENYWLGDISYSFYLTHSLVGGNVLYLLIRFSDNIWPKTGMVVLALAVSLIFAHFFWKWIEDPARKLSKRIRIN